MFNHIDKILSSEGMGSSLARDYSRICGDESEDGFADSLGRFSNHLSSTPLKYLTPAASDPTLVLGAWRSFLTRRDGCPGHTQGSRLFDPSVSRRRVQGATPIEGQGVLVETASGPVAIGVSSSEVARYAKAAAVLPAEEFPSADPAVLPLPLALADKAYLFGEETFFGYSLSFSDVALARSDDFTLRIFEGARYRGSLNLVEALYDEERYTHAWKGYLDRVLARAESAVEALDAAVERGWENISDDERGRLVAALSSLTEEHAAGAAFNIGDTSHPLAKTYGYVFGRTQLAKLGNVMMSVSVLMHALALDLEEPADFANARDHLLTLFDPFDHLDKSFRLETNMRPYLEISLPSSLPRIEAQNPKALRKMIDAIVLEAGGNGGALDFRWDEEGMSIVATDAGRRGALLGLFSHGGEGYMTVSASRARLESLASELGDGGEVRFTGGSGENSPLSISIRVPLLKKKPFGAGFDDTVIATEDPPRRNGAADESADATVKKNAGTPARKARTLKGAASKAVGAEAFISAQPTAKLR